jgi:hypothetical protein
VDYARTKKCSSRKTPSNHKVQRRSSGDRRRVAPSCVRGSALHGQKEKGNDYPIVPSIVPGNAGNIIGEKSKIGRRRHRSEKREPISAFSIDDDKSRFPTLAFGFRCLPTPNLQLLYFPIVIKTKLVPWENTGCMIIPGDQPGAASRSKATIVRQRVYFRVFSLSSPIMYSPYFLAKLRGMDKHSLFKEFAKMHICEEL